MSTIGPHARPIHFPSCCHTWTRYLPCRPVSKRAELRRVCATRTSFDALSSNTGSLPSLSSQSKTTWAFRHSKAVANHRRDWTPPARTAPRQFESGILGPDSRGLLSPRFEWSGRSTPNPACARGFRAPLSEPGVHAIDGLAGCDRRCGSDGPRAEIKRRSPSRISSPVTEGRGPGPVYLTLKDVTDRTPTG